jgi:hypothetical protein
MQLCRSLDTEVELCRIHSVAAEISVDSTSGVWTRGDGGSVSLYAQQHYLHVGAEESLQYLAHLPGVVVGTAVSDGTVFASSWIRCYEEYPVERCKRSLRKFCVLSSESIKEKTKSVMGSESTDTGAGLPSMPHRNRAAPLQCLMCILV